MLISLVRKSLIVMRTVLHITLTLSFYNTLASLGGLASVSTLVIMFNIVSSYAFFADMLVAYRLTAYHIPSIYMR